MRVLPKNGSLAPPVDGNNPGSPARADPPVASAEFEAPGCFRRIVPGADLKPGELAAGLRDPAADRTADSIRSWLLLDLKAIGPMSVRRACFVASSFGLAFKSERP